MKHPAFAGNDIFMRKYPKNEEQPQDHYRFISYNTLNKGHSVDIGVSTPHIKGISQIVESRPSKGEWGEYEVPTSYRIICNL